MAIDTKGFSVNKPVFSFSSGKNLTKKQINLWLSTLLDDFVDSNHKITGHSFRAGIPSTLASFPDEYSVKIIKEWGMWESNCYKLYSILSTSSKGKGNEPSSKELSLACTAD